MYYRAFLVATALLVLGANGKANAAVMIFETAGGDDLGAFFSVPNESGTYGDRISAEVQGNYRYDLTHGETPEVAVTYSQNTHGFESGFGNLTNVAYTDVNLFEVVFSADAGFAVGLIAFDLAGFGGDKPNRLVSVLDGMNNVLFTQSNVTIQGDPGEHTSFNFASSPLTAQTIKVQFQPGNNEVAIDNIAFNQVQNTAVPEPSSIVTLLVGCAALAGGSWWRKRKAKLAA